MTLLQRLAWRVGREIARRPGVRTRAGEVLAETHRVLNDEVRPCATKVWQDVQPQLEHAARELRGMALELRDAYRRGRDDA